MTIIWYRNTSSYKYNLGVGSWKRLFKWKPLEEQSIDFYVEVVKNKDGSDSIFHKTIDISGIEQVICYKKLRLYVGINRLERTAIISNNPCTDVAGSINSKNSNLCLFICRR